MFEILLIVTILIDLAVDFLDRQSTRGSDPYSLTLWTGIVQSLLIFPVIGLVGSISPGQLFLCALVAMIASLGRMQWYSALAERQEDLSRIAPFRRFSSVFVLLLAVVLLGEKLSIAQGAGASLIIAGAFLVTLDRPRANLRSFVHNNRAAGLVLMFSFSSACISVLYKFLLTAGVSIWTCYFYMRLFQLLVLLAAGMHTGGVLRAHAHISNVRLFVFGRCLQTVSTFIYLVVLNNIPLTRAQPIAALGPFIVLAAEWLLVRMRAGTSPGPSVRAVVVPAGVRLLRITALAAVAAGIVLLAAR